MAVVEKHTLQDGQQERRRSFWRLRVLRGSALDTITTRFLLLFLFAMVIPLFSLILFATTLLNEQIGQEQQQQLRIADEAFGALWDIRPQRNESGERYLQEFYKKHGSVQAETWLLKEPVNPTAPQWIGRYRNLPQDQVPEGQRGLLLRQLNNSEMARPTIINLPDERQIFVLQRLVPGFDQKPLRVIHMLPAKREEKQSFFFSGIYMITVCGIFVAILLAMVGGRPVTQPLIHLIQQANAIKTDTLQETEEMTVHGVYEINQLNKAFNRMLDRLRQTNRLKDEFVATLTHDLKVPLLAEKQTLTYLSKGTYGPLSPDQQEIIEAIRLSNSSSLDLVKGLLEVYRYDAGQATLKPSLVDLRQLMTETVQELKALAMDKQIALEVAIGDGDSHALVDRLEIKRTLQNLISNAVTNTPRHGHVRCRLQRAEELGRETLQKLTDLELCTLTDALSTQNQVLISVEDSGIGFSKEDLPHLFTRFRANRGRNPMSTGLGLYNCYQVVQAHGGVLWVESTEGEGSAVSLMIPVHGEQTT